MAKKVQMRRTTRIDMHVHTRGSDGWGTPDQIAQAALDAGLDGLCITDHHLTFTPEGIAVAKACRDAGLLVFHGCEYSSKQGHVLVYGVSVEEMQLPWYPPMQDVIDLAEQFGGVAIPAHPYYGAYKAMLGDGLLQLSNLTAVEVANGQRAVWDKPVNAKANRVAKTLQLAGIGGSDAHDPDYVGVCYTEFQGVIESTTDLIDALLEGRCRAITQHGRVKELRSNSSRFWNKKTEKYTQKFWNQWDGDLDTKGIAGHFDDDDEHGSGSQFN